MDNCRIYISDAEFIYLMWDFYICSMIYISGAGFNKSVAVFIKSVKVYKSAVSDKIPTIFTVLRLAVSHQ